MNSIILKSSVNIISRFITIIYQALLIPMVINDFGIEFYGVFAISQGLIIWITLLDFGGGTYFQNVFSKFKMIQRPNDEFFGYCLSFFFLVLMFILFVANFSSEISHHLLGDREFGDFLVVSIITISFFTLTEFFTKIMFSLEKSLIVGICSILGYVISTIIITSIDMQSLESVILVSYIPIILIRVLLYSPVIYKIFIRLKCELSIISIIQCYKRTTKFFWFTLVACITLNIDILIAHNLLSSEEVGVYFLVSKIFATGFMVFSILIQIYWPTIVNQIIDLEFDSLSVFMKKMFIFFTLSILVCSSVLIIYLLNIDNYDYFDVSDNFNKSTILLVSLFSVYYIIRVVCDLYATLLQCWGETSVLNKVVPIQAIISAALQIIFGYYFGMEGLVLGMLVSFICTVLYALPKEYKRLVKDSLV